MPPDATPVEANHSDSEPLQSGWLAADIFHDAGHWPAMPELRRALASALSALTAAPPFVSHEQCEMCIALSDDANVQKLNAAYRGKDKPTNVLSFPASSMQAQSDVRILGDVILARETLEREASELAIPLMHHVQHLTIHGVLHLLGYDHETDDEANKMERLETRILASIGVADPYETAAGIVRPSVMSE